MDNFSYFGQMTPNGLRRAKKNYENCQVAVRTLEESLKATPPSNETERARIENELIQARAACEVAHERCCIIEMQLDDCD